MKVPVNNYYEDGKLTNQTLRSEENKIKWAEAFRQDPESAVASGEKFWLVGSWTLEDGVVLTFLSDPYGNDRYYGRLIIPYPKGVFPLTEVVMKTIAEVVTVDNAVQEAPEVSLVPIAPPPPPTDAPPKTVSVGQTKDQVVAILGQPQKIANLGAKEIDYYSDMKVIFMQGKVTDVQ